MAYDFTQFKKDLDSVREWLSGEFQGIRTGRATPAVLDSLTVDAYGSRSPISHVATISIEGPRSLRVLPWDKGQVKDIEKAIITSGLGVTASVDDQGVRVNFPELTAENRAMLAKIVREKLEDARVSVRQERDKVWQDIQEKEKKGEISEDEKFRYKDEMQKIVDASNKTLEELVEKKEKEISA